MSGIVLCTPSDEPLVKKRAAGSRVYMPHTFWQISTQLLCDEYSARVLCIQQP